MVIENQIPKTETVTELKDEYKVPSFEEFMKTYQEEERTINDYEFEVDSYGDLRVKGFWDDINCCFPTGCYTAIAAPITIYVAA